MSGVEGIEDIDNLSRTLDVLLSSQPVRTLWLCFDALPGTCTRGTPVLPLRCAAGTMVAYGARECAPERSFDVQREFAKHIQNRHPHIVIRNSYPLLATLRKIKVPEEIDAIRNAMQITEAGNYRMMRVAKPGMMEEIESLMAYKTF